MNARHPRNGSRFRDPSLSSKNIAGGQRVGPFLADGTEGRDLVSLRLLSLPRRFERFLASVQHCERQDPATAAAFQRRSGIVTHRASFTPPT